jgi:hypothetical protein
MKKYEPLVISKEYFRGELSKKINGGSKRVNP